MESQIEGVLALELDIYRCKMYQKNDKISKVSVTHLGITSISEFLVSLRCCTGQLQLALTPAPVTHIYIGTYL